MTELHKAWLYDDAGEGAALADLPTVPAPPPALPELTNEQCAGMDDTP